MASKILTSGYSAWPTPSPQWCRDRNFAWRRIGALRIQCAHRDRMSYHRVQLPQPGGDHPGSRQGRRDRKVRCRHSWCQERWLRKHQAKRRGMRLEALWGVWLCWDERDSRLKRCRSWSWYYERESLCFRSERALKERHTYTIQLLLSWTTLSTRRFIYLPINLLEHFPNLFEKRPCWYLSFRR